MTEEPLDVAYGQAVRIARRAKGIRTQDELGDMIGRSGKMVQHYEKGRHLTPEVRALLEQALGPIEGSGDAVLAALGKSELIDWRRSAVKQEYEKQLYLQKAAGERREEGTG